MPASPLQLRLLPPARPLDERLGAEFFRELPRQPGVYRFLSADGQLLYVGKAGNLRQRLGSYRSLLHASRKTVRLVHQVCTITWEVCDSEESATLRENELLRTHRPRFNRAGVWPDANGYLELIRSDDHLWLRFRRRQAGNVAEDKENTPENEALRRTAHAAVRIGDALSTNHESDGVRHHRAVSPEQDAGLDSVSPPGVRYLGSPPFLAELLIGHEPGGAKLPPSLVRDLDGMARQQPRPTTSGRFMGSPPGPSQPEGPASEAGNERWLFGAFKPSARQAGRALLRLLWGHREDWPEPTWLPASLWSAERAPAPGLSQISRHLTDLLIAFLRGESNTLLNVLAGFAEVPGSPFLREFWRRDWELASDFFRVGPARSRALRERFGRGDALIGESELDDLLVRWRRDRTAQAY